MLWSESVNCLLAVRSNLVWYREPSTLNSPRMTIAAMAIATVLPEYRAPRPVIFAPDVLGVERDVDAQQQHARGDQDAPQQAKLALNRPHAKPGEQTEDAKRRQRKAQRFEENRCQIC